MDRDSQIKSKCMITKGERGVMKDKLEEFGIKIYMLLHVK